MFGFLLWNRSMDCCMSAARSALPHQENRRVTGPDSDSSPPPVPPPQEVTVTASSSAATDMANGLNRFNITTMASPVTIALTEPDPGRQCRERYEGVTPPSMALVFRPAGNRCSPMVERVERAVERTSK